MVTKSVGTYSTISAFSVFCHPLPPYNVVYFEIWAQSLNTGVRFFLPNVVSSNIKIFPGGGGYRFPLRDDLLRMRLKGRRGTFSSIFCCVPTTFGNDCSYELVLLIASITLLSRPPKGIKVMHYEIIVEGGRALECIGHLPSVYNVIVIFQLCSVIMINSGVDTVDFA